MQENREKMEGCSKQLGRNKKPEYKRHVNRSMCQPSVNPRGFLGRVTERCRKYTRPITCEEVASDWQVRPNVGETWERYLSVTGGGACLME